MINIVLRPATQPFDPCNERIDLFHKQYFLHNGWSRKLNNVGPDFCTAKIDESVVVD